MMKTRISRATIQWLALAVLLSAGAMWQAASAAQESAQTAPRAQQTAGGNGLLPRLLGGGSRLLGRLNNGTDRLLDGAGGGLRRVAQGVRGQFLEPIPDNTTTFETALEYQGLGRTVRYITPAESDDQTRAPAIVLLHFGYGTPESMANLTHIAELVSETGVWVILPSAVNRHWQESPLVAPSNDDVGYLDAVIQDAIDNYPIDPRRVYMAGLSNGGFMTNRFLCAHPQRIAAAAVVGASMRTLRRRQCSAEGEAAVPMLIIDGTQDPIVPYDGRFGLQSVPGTFDYWLERDGCDSAATIDSELPDIAEDGTRVTERDNTACAHNTGVRLLTVEGGGHAWPGGETHTEGLILGRTSQDISATEQLWQFFQQHRRP